jgi:hypothetical protein
MPYSDNIIYLCFLCNVVFKIAQSKWELKLLDSFPKFFNIIFNQNQIIRSRFE